MARLRSHPVRPICRAALAALVLACLGAWPALAQEGGDLEWPQFQGGPGHAGVAVQAPVPPYRELWRFTPADGALSGAVVAGGLAISVGIDAVYALDLRTGDVAWQVPRNGGLLSMPAAGLAGERQVLVFIDGPRGAEDDADASSTPSASPTSSPSASVSPSPGAEPAGAAVSELVAIDLADHSELWRTPLGAVSRSGVTIDGDRAFVADDDGTVSAVELGTGAVAWTAEAVGRVESPPAAADGQVYVVARDADGQKAQVLALDEATGGRAWEFSPQAGAVAVSAAAAGGGAVEFGAADRLVRGLSAGDGEVRFTALSLTLFSPVSAPALAPNGVFIADASGGVYRIDPTDGARTWQHQLNDLIVRSSPVVTGSFALVGLNDGRLVALDVETGDLVWESAATPGLIGTIALARDVVVAVKGGKEAGLIAFEHDPEGTLVRVPSPTVMDAGRLFGNFAIAFVVAAVAIFVPFRLLRARLGPAFWREPGGDDLTDEDSDDEEAP